MIWENIKLAFSSMWANKMRTILSLLGIVIGVASVVAILTLGDSLQSNITDSLNSGGLDTISVSITSNKYSDTFDELFGETLMTKVSGIEKVIPTNSSSTRIRYKQEIETSTVYGIPSTYFEDMGLSTETGEFFTVEDNITKRQVVVLGHDIAEDLFPAGNAVGQYISIFRRQSKRYMVVGVLEEKDATLTGSFNEGIYIPYNTYTQRFTRTTYVGTYIVKVLDGFDPIEVGDNISDYMDELCGSDNYTLISAASLSEMASEITGTISEFLAAIAGISLVVGGIGIMNIMLVSVAERTREIGIRKALGAAPRIIRGQFITEAIAITLTGGFIGILLGTLLSQIVVSIAGWTLAISVKAWIISVGFSMLIGVFFGWYPAKKASQLDPIQALNYE